MDNPAGRRERNVTDDIFIQIRDNLSANNDLYGQIRDAILAIPPPGPSTPTVEFHSGIANLAAGEVTILAPWVTADSVIVATPQSL
jgi:hypothetical protein